MAFKLTIEIVVFIFVICVLIGLSIWALCKKDNFSNEKKQKCEYCKDCPMPETSVVGIDSLNNLNKMCNDPRINCDKIKIYIDTNWVCNHVAQPADTIYSLTPMK